MEIARCKMAIDKLVYLGESEKGRNIYIYMCIYMIYDIYIHDIYIHIYIYSSVWMVEEEHGSFTLWLMRFNRLNFRARIRILPDFPRILVFHLMGRISINLVLR